LWQRAHLPPTSETTPAEMMNETDATLADSVTGSQSYNYSAGVVEG
jgi:hypothetical protein